MNDHRPMPHYSILKTEIDGTPVPAGATVELTLLCHVGDRENWWWSPQHQCDVIPLTVFDWTGPRVIEDPAKPHLVDAQAQDARLEDDQAIRDLEDLGTPGGRDG